MSERQWYFAENNQRCGPTSENELRQMLTAGRLPAATLVWTAGLTNWKPASQVASFAEIFTRPAAPVVPSIDPVHAAHAPAETYQPQMQQPMQSHMQTPVQSQVQQPVQSEMQSEVQPPANDHQSIYQQVQAQRQQNSQTGAGPQEGSYRPPTEYPEPSLPSSSGSHGDYPRPSNDSQPSYQYGNHLAQQDKPQMPVQSNREGGFGLQWDNSGVQGAWRCQSQMVLQARGSKLPHRCIKCNGEATRSLTKTFYWSNPAWYLLIFLGWLVALIVVMCVRKPVWLDIGLCEEHFAKRRRSIMIAWGVAAAGLAFLIAGVFGAEAKIPFISSLIFIGPLMMMIAPIYGCIAARVVTINKVDNQYAWLSGVSPEYMASLPNFLGNNEGVYR